MALQIIFTDGTGADGLQVVFGAFINTAIADTYNDRILAQQAAAAAQTSASQAAASATGAATSATNAASSATSAASSASAASASATSASSSATAAASSATAAATSATNAANSATAAANSATAAAASVAGDRTGGSTASRPASPALYQRYFDTTLGYPIFCSNTSPITWVNAVGATV